MASKHGRLVKEMKIDIKPWNWTSGEDRAAWQDWSMWQMPRYAEDFKEAKLSRTQSIPNDSHGTDMCGEYPKNDGLNA